jgi:1,4-alpha-glucan branching enzyme
MLQQSSMRHGHLALILHAHLPFVRHPEHPEFLEEDWFFEAITETYIPLIAMMRRLVRDAVPFKLTMSITPTLAAMLQDHLLRDRYVRHLDRSIELARREVERNQHGDQLRALAEFYHDNFRASRHWFVDQWNGDLLAAFRQLRDDGALEIIACAATHGVLPLLAQTSQALRAQVLIGRDEYVRAFGVEPTGFWLPECAYSPEVEPALQEANIRWFVLDAHGLMFANPPPVRAIYAPCYTPSGPAAFARDRESSRAVWSARGGYPGDPAYREFYRDIGFDLPLDQLAMATRKFTGIKYHRVTGGDRDKEIYELAAAERVADAHAQHFLEQRQQQIAELAASGFEPIVIAPFDAELFGHWWFEGPRFLELFIRKAAYDQQDFQLTTPSDYLAAHPTQQTVSPATSSWGANGYLEVWVNEKNSWIYAHLHAAARRMTELARSNMGGASRMTERVLKQLARELLLAEASDWPFLINSGTAKEYASKRATDHLLRFNRLYEQFVAGTVDEQFLASCESRDNLFADVNWRYYI